MPILRVCLLLALLSLVIGCKRQDADGQAGQAGKITTQTVASPEEGGAVSRAPVVTSAPDARPAPAPPARAADWSPIQLTSGQAWIDCGLDYRQGDGEPFSSPSRANLRHLIEPCRPGDVLRVRYRGKIASDFTTLVERVTRVADSLGVNSRVLDLDSTGGQVEDAIRAGDWIGANHWTIWVREDSVCHSACVFVLAGGDSRRLAGRVGIHRIIRLSSTATSRTELNTELQAVYSTVREYLERNGASPLLADVMKTVPNRSLRLLTSDELLQYGLDGNNAAQDDLERVRLLDKCGDDFMRRRDAWVRAFDERCRTLDGVYALNACGLQLRRDFGFPDDDCPAESPLAEFNELPEPLPVEAPVPTPIGDAGKEEVDAKAAAGAAIPEAATAGGETPLPTGRGG
jgi:ATP-dependent protease ClpP protease subunit